MSIYNEIYWDSISETLDHSTPGKQLPLEATWADYQDCINKHFRIVGNGLFILELNEDEIDFEGKMKDGKVVEILNEDSGAPVIHCYFKQAWCNPWKSYKIKIGNAINTTIEAEAVYDIITYATEQDSG